MAQEKIKPIEVTNALRDLGITEQVIADAVLEGESERDFCSPHHPKTMPGFVSWGSTIRALRDALVVYGWTAREDRNYPTVVNPTGTLAIAVATGDEGTGLPGMFPNVKSSKGSVTKNVVLINQLKLFPDFAISKGSDRGECLTWLLLRRRDRNRVYFELSLPASMNDGFIVEWETRILFEPRDIDGDGVYVIEDNTEQFVDVGVMRKVQG